MKQTIQLKLGQTLTMTPQLQQAIKLLQMTRMELQGVLTQELVENPVLEETPAEPPGTTERQEEAAPAETAEPAISGAVAQRLKKLDKLYSDGVISADEYRQHRNRILGEL